MKGWEYAFENIEETAKLIYEKYNPQNKSLNSLIYEANEMKKLVYDKMVILELFLKKNQSYIKYL